MKAIDRKKIGTALLLGTTTSTINAATIISAREGELNKAFNLLDVQFADQYERSEQLGKENQKQKEIISELQHTVEDEQGANQRLTIAKQEAEDDLKDGRNVAKSMISGVYDHMMINDANYEDVEELTTKLEKAESARDNLQKLLEEITKELTQADTGRANLQKQLDEATATKNQANGKLLKENGMLYDVINKLVEVDASRIIEIVGLRDLTWKQGKIVDVLRKNLEGDDTDYPKENRTLKADLEQTKEELDKTKAELASEKKLLDETYEQVDSLKKQLKKALADVENQKGLAEEQGEELNKRNGALKKLQEELAIAKHQLEPLKGANERLDFEAKSLRNQNGILANNQPLNAKSESIREVCGASPDNKDPYLKCDLSLLVGDNDWMGKFEVTVKPKVGDSFNSNWLSQYIANFPKDIKQETR